MARSRLAAASRDGRTRRSAVYWFHPAIWWVISHARAAREELVDELAIAMTGRRQAYLRALLAFADRPQLAAAAPFGDRNQLFQRMLRISREESMSSTRLVFSALVLLAVVAASGWAATMAFPLEQAVDAPGQSRGPEFWTAFGPHPGPIERGARLASADHPVPRRVHDVPALFPSGPAAREVSVTLTLRTTVDESGAVAETRLVGLQVAGQGFSLAVVGDGMDERLRWAYRGLIKRAPGGEVLRTATLEPVLTTFIESGVEAVRQWRYDSLQDGAIAFDVTVHFGEPIAQAMQRR